MKNLLVSIGFDDNEQLLIDKAFQLAHAFNSKIWLIHIAAPNPDFIGYEAGPQYIRDGRAEELRNEHRLIQKYADELQEKGVDAEGLLVQGPTTDMIIAETEKLNIDLIIAGHHKYNFLYEIFIGSVSEEIIKKSKIPILLVPLG